MQLFLCQIKNLNFLGQKIKFSSSNDSGRQVSSFVGNSLKNGRKKQQNILPI